MGLSWLIRVVHSLWRLWAEKLGDECNEGERFRRPAALALNRQVWRIGLFRFRLLPHMFDAVMYPPVRDIPPWRALFFTQWLNQTSREFYLLGSRQISGALTDLEFYVLHDSREANVSCSDFWRTAATDEMGLLTFLPVLPFQFQKIRARVSCMSRHEEMGIQMGILSISCTCWIIVCRLS